MLQRFWNLIKGFFALVLKKTETENPDALLEVEVENLRSQIARYNQGLIAHAGLCERLMTQIKSLEKEQTELQAKISVHLKANNREAAGLYALRLQTVEKELIENRAQSEHAEAVYKELTQGRDTAVASAKAKIESIRAGIADMKMSQSIAELSEMTAGLVSSVGGSGDTMDRLSKMVEEERIRSAGRARVAKDGMKDSSVDQKVQAETQDALAAQALKDYEAKKGSETYAPNAR